MRSEIKSQIEKIKTKALEYQSNKNKLIKNQLERLLDEIINNIDKLNSEENTYIISNILPITNKIFNGFSIGTLLLEKPRIKVSKSIWSILINDDLIKKSISKPIEYTVSPFNTGLEKIFKDVVSKDDLRPNLTGINYENGTATGTDAHKLLHVVSENKNSFKDDGTYHLISDIEKEYNKEKLKYSDLKMSFKEYYDLKGKIDANYPSWSSIVPRHYMFYKTFDLVYLNNILLTIYKNNLTNPVTNTFVFEFKTEDGVFHIGFNAELLSELCQSMILAGERMVNFYFSTERKALIVINNKVEIPNEDADYFFMKNTFGLIMPVMLLFNEDTIEEDLMNYPLIKYNSTYDFDIRIGDSPIYNLIEGENKVNKNKEVKTKSKSEIYKELIEGYKLALEIETDKQKIKTYKDLIEGYDLALELE